MKQFFLVLLCFIVIKSYGQDTVRKRSELRTMPMKTDTNRLVYDEQGNTLHYYQYQKLMNTGDYTFRSSANPGDPNVKLYLKKLTDQEKTPLYDRVKKMMAIKSPSLQEGLELNITPLTQVYKPADLEGKVIVLIFWNVNCPPCTEGFGSLNEFLQQIRDSDNLVVIAVTPDNTETASDKLKEKPLHHAQLLSNARSIMNGYQLSTFPSYVVTDKNHVIRFAISGSGPFTLPAFKSVIKSVLFQ